MTWRISTVAVGDDHPIDQQLHQLALLGEFGTGQAGPNPLAEIRGRGRPAGELGPPIRLCFQLAGLRHQCLQPLLQRLPPTPVFRQRDDGEQVRFSQAFQLPLEVATGPGAAARAGPAAPAATSRRRARGSGLGQRARGG